MPGDKFFKGIMEHNADGTKGLSRMSAQDLIKSIKEEIIDTWFYLSELERRSKVVQPTPHPYFRLPTQDEALSMGRDKLAEILYRREEAIQQSNRDPFHNGIEPPQLEDGR